MLKVQEIRELIKLIDESTIEEFTYETDGTKVSMKKTLETLKVEPAQVTNQKQVNTGVVETEPSVQSNNANPVMQEEIKEENTNIVNFDYEIKSPMVGTYYSSPDPDSSRYVSVGDRVNNDSVVCIVEAMKLFNEIEAETNGEIVEILVEDGELVEYGQPLFRVKTK